MKSTPRGRTYFFMIEKGNFASRNLTKIHCEWRHKRPANTHRQNEYEYSFLLLPKSPYFNDFSEIFPRSRNFISSKLLEVPNITDSAQFFVWYWMKFIAVLDKAIILKQFSPIWRFAVVLAEGVMSWCWWIDCHEIISFGLILCARIKAALIKWVKNVGLPRFWKFFTGKKKKAIRQFKKTFKK